MTQLADKKIIPLVFSKEKQAQDFVRNNKELLKEMYSVYSRAGIYHESYPKFIGEILFVPKKGAHYFLLYKDNKLIGLANGAHGKLQSDKFYLERIGIVPEHQGKGIGKDFITKILIDLRKSGYHKFDSIVDKNGHSIKIAKALADRFNKTIKVKEEPTPLDHIKQEIHLKPRNIRK